MRMLMLIGLLSCGCPKAPETPKPEPPRKEKAQPTAAEVQAALMRKFCPEVPQQALLLFSVPEEGCPVWWVDADCEAGAKDKRTRAEAKRFWNHLKGKYPKICEQRQNGEQ